MEVDRRSLKACLCGPACSTLGFCRLVVVVAHLESTLEVVGGRLSGASGLSYEDLLLLAYVCLSISNLSQCSTLVRNTVVRATFKVNGKPPILGSRSPLTP